MVQFQSIEIVIYTSYHPETRKTIVFSPYWAPNSLNVGTIIHKINPNLPFVVLNLLKKFHRDPFP